MIARDMQDACPPFLIKPHDSKTNTFTTKTNTPSTKTNINGTKTNTPTFQTFASSRLCDLRD